MLERAINDRVEELLLGLQTAAAGVEGGSAMCRLETTDTHDSDSPKELLALLSLSNRLYFSAQFGSTTRYIH